MKPRGRVRRDEYPSDDLLRELTRELEDGKPDASISKILDLAKVNAFPSPLSPCWELDVSQTDCSFVLSQSRSRGERYITVCGKRSRVPGKGVKNQRSTLPWPRTRATDRLRPISLHRWICFAMRGPPSTDREEATHVCDNECCIAAAHLRWQTRDQNVEDQAFKRAHAVSSPAAPQTDTVSARRYSRCSWQE